MLHTNWINIFFWIIILCIIQIDSTMALIFLRPGDWKALYLFLKATSSLFSLQIIPRMRRKTKARGGAWWACSKGTRFRVIERNGMRINSAKVSGGGNSGDPRHQAAAAKSLQSCSTLCNPRDGSPPGSPVPGIFQARTLEWVALSFSNAWKWKWRRSVMSDS